MLVVEINLKDGTHIPKCMIYEKAEKGELPIQDEETINSKFQVYPWGNEWRNINFQTPSMNGYIPVTNVEDYKIYECDKF